MIGTKLGSYELVEEVGHGGMATVFRALQPNVDRYVAVKVIHRSIALDSKSLDRFTREARLVAKLEHPHILPVYDYNGQNDPPYIVMRYLPTGTLKDILERESLPYAEVGFLMSQVSSALDYAHRQGVVHRDIKPSNIMVDADGNAFLTDFGIARMVEGGEGLTGSGMAIGTPGYMAPEQGLGMPIDGRADIYALGVMIYEMLTGRVPYSAETPMAVILKHINDPVPEPTLVNPSLPPAVNGVIQKAMAKQPEARYSTATELSRALAAALGSSTDMTPARLQAVAARTIVDLEKNRQEAAKNKPPATIGEPIPAPRGATGTGINSISQTMSKPVVQGAAAGIGIFVVLLLLLGGVFLFVSNKNNSDATSTYVAAAQTNSAQQTLVAVGATQTESARPTSTATFTASVVPTTQESTKVAVVVPTTQDASETPKPIDTTAPTLTPTTVPPSETPVPPTFTPTQEPPTPVPPTDVPPTTAPSTAVAQVPDTNPPAADPNAVLRSGKFPYVNDFEDTKSLDGWDFDKTVWKQQTDSGNVALVGSGDFKSPAIVLSGKNPAWSAPAATSLFISLRIYLDTPSSISRMIYRQTDGGYYLLEFGVGRVVIKRGKSADFTRVGDERIVARITNTQIAPGKWYLVETWSNEGRNYVYLDHKLVLSSVDNDDPLPGGQIVFQSYNKNFRTRLDNFKVSVPLNASQHFEVSDWPTTWSRSSETGARLVAGANSNNFVDVTSGDISPINPPVENLRMSCRIWNQSGGQELRIRESKAGVILFQFAAGNLTLKQIDASDKVVKQWSFPSFYGRGDYIDLAIETIGSQLRIFKEPSDFEFSETLTNAPPAGGIRFTAANEGDEFRLDDCLFVETSLVQTEDASWAIEKVNAVEKRTPQPLLSEWYDRFDDQFRTKDWWDGGVNAPGEFKVNSADTAHPNYLEMTYKDGASWRIFRNIKDVYAFGLDTADIYLKTSVRVLNSGTAWIAARTAVSLGGGKLNGYRLEVTRKDDGSYLAKAWVVSPAGEPVFYEGPLPANESADPDWVDVLVVTYVDKVAFFANGRLLAATSKASLVTGTIALGVESGTTADFDNLELRDVSPETR